MSRRVLAVGRPDTVRMRLGAALDSAFDVDLEHAPDALGAVALLPSRAVDLFIVLADGGTAPGLDLLRLLREHQAHGAVPIVFVGGSAAQRQTALALGASLLASDSPDDEIRQVARRALAIGSRPA